ncbi:hypothetical protein, partial [Solidesulfovibrio sp.]|uniref:hypothetical protein n=1 Tax=Solidesulfovibrio sp. TaxID=2910990 RepID=UPI00263577C9
AHGRRRLIPRLSSPAKARTPGHGLLAFFMPLVRPARGTRVALGVMAQAIYVTAQPMTHLALPGWHHSLCFTNTLTPCESVPIICSKNSSSCRFDNTSIQATSNKTSITLNKQQSKHHP